MEQFFERSFSGLSSEHEGKKYELIRLGTFSNWPPTSLQYSTKLARAGFCYEGNGDEVLCYVCGVKKSKWLESDDPFVVHKQISIDCQFFSSVSNNVPVERGQGGVTSLSPFDRYIDSDLIQRLENLEVRDLSDLGTAASGLPNRIDSNLSSTETDTQGEENPNLPKSRSADQINKSMVSSNGQFSMTTDSVASSLPRSTSFPSSVIVQNQADCLEKISSKARATSNSKKETNTAAAGGSVNIGSKSYDLSKLRYEKNRLDTFKKWPRHIKVSPQELAKSGFFYTGVSDRVMCVFCKGALRNWDEGDRPNFEHRKHFPKCRHVLGLEVGNVPLAAVPKTQEQIRKEQLSKDVMFSVDSTKLGDLGIITEKPKNPRYSIYSDRLGTFKGWPPTKNQTPEKLADAGFFYAGFSDNVKCFYCNGGLRNWEPGDEPWIEHAKWFKKCPFIKQVKGEPFILQVQHQKNRDESILSQLNPPEESTPPSGKGQTQSQRRVPLQSDLLGMQRVEEREIRARMDSSMVKVVQSMGMSSEVVARVIRNKLLREGDDFSSATDLIEAIFKQEEEDKRRPNDSDLQEVEENQAGSHSVGGDEMSTDKDREPCNGNEAVGSNGVVFKEKKDAEKVIVDKKNDASKTENDDSKKSVDDLEKENIDLKEQRLCKICMVNDSSIVFLPCGHLVACAACSPALDNCPICRQPIQGFIRTFIA